MGFNGVWVIGFNGFNGVQWVIGFNGFNGFNGVCVNGYGSWIANMTVMILIYLYLIKINQCTPCGDRTHDL